MKYTIVINQKALVELAPHLDITDYAILDYLRHLCGSVSEAVEKQRVRDDNGTWTWVNYAHLMAELPALKIKSGSAISKRVQGIQQAGFIDSMKGKGFRLYVRMLPLVEAAFSETKASVRTDESQRSFKRKDHNTSNQDTTIHPPRADATREVEEIIKAFEAVNPNAYRLYQRPNQRQAVQRLIKRHGYAKVHKWVSSLPHILRMRGAPQITTPMQFEEKLGQLAIFTQQQSQSKYTIASV